MNLGLLAHSSLALPLAGLAAVGCTSAPREQEAAAETASRTWSIDDTLELVRIGEVAMSPDGEWVLFSERRLDWEANDYVTEYNVISSHGGEPLVLHELEGAGDPRFTPEGGRISFLRADDDDSDQIFTVDLTGRAAEQVTSHPGGVNLYAWSPDGAHVYFAADEPRETAEQAAWDAGGDAVLVGENGNGLDAQRWSDLWVHDLATGEEQRLTDLRVTITALDVAPDGERVVFVGASDNRTNYFWRSELYVANRSSGMTVQLTDNEAPEDDPIWSPDGRLIAYHSPDPEWFDLRNGYVWILDSRTGDARRLDGQHQGEIGALEWSSDGEHLLFGESRGVDANLYQMHATTGEVRALTSVEGTLRPQVFAADGSRYAYTYQDSTSAPDLYAADLAGGEPTRLTSSNPWIGQRVALGASEVVRWTSSDGRAIEGVLTLPPGYDGAEPLPLIMDIHGGPPGYWGAQLEPEHQLYAGMGYAVFGPNPRGSSSYGDDHLRALMGDVGGGEYDDLMTGVDHLIARGVADPERLALRGWSWGGILGAWTIAHTDRFRAASLGAMVGDWAAEIGGGLMYDLRLHYIESEPWEDPEEWRKRSALTYVANVATPTILLHGEEDGVSTVNQSQMFYTALRERDVPVRFVKFPRQGHGIREPRLRRIALVEEVRWFERHVRGERWTPPPRGESAAEATSAPDHGWLDADRELTDVDRFLIERMDEAHVPGLAAAVVRDGELLWAGAYGWADVDGRVPVRDDTLFQLASISKTVTATAILQLVEQGVLDLDADIDEVLPFSVRHPAYPDVPITLRQLLTHTAGLRDNWIVLEGTWVRDADFPMSLRDSVAAYFLPGGELYSADKNFQAWSPGTRNRYANVGFPLAALVAETAAGVPFEHLASERVLSPLGIEGGYRLAEVDSAQVAVPHRWTRGEFVAEGHHSYLDFPSGTLRVSARGLASFLLAFQRGGELGGVRVLAEETVADMLTVQLPEIDEDQGLAWYRQRLGGEELWGHDGGDPGVATQMFFRPSDGAGFVLLMNGEPRGRGAERAIARRLFALADEGGDR